MDIDNNEIFKGNKYTLGFNFQDSLIDQLTVLREQNFPGRVVEVFGALDDSPVLSARPQNKIPTLTQEEFAQQVAKLKKIGIEFNYLMNTSEKIKGKEDEVVSYVKQLISIGVKHVTVGSLKLASLLRKNFGNEIHLTMSITFGISDEKTLEKVIQSGCDACYLDGVNVNRNFKLLTHLISVAKSRIEIRLYANMSCIAECPVVKQHYKLFSSRRPDVQERHKGYFRGCSAIKLTSPVTWIQAPAIRPEDVEIYRELGVELFKLSDRLAPTKSLAFTAWAYSMNTSPADLFHLYERTGEKYRDLFTEDSSPPLLGPFSVSSSEIPQEFIQHFQDGRCNSTNAQCPICMSTANDAISVNDGWEEGIEVCKQMFRSETHVSPDEIGRI